MRSQPRADGSVVLASTLGPLVPAEDAASLEASDRAALERWLQQRWVALESRAGHLAERDAARWYELLALERWTDHRPPVGLSPDALAVFYRLKRLVPRGTQLALRRLLVRWQGRPTFPRWPFEPAGGDLLRIAVAARLLSSGTDRVRFPWFWPRGATAAVALTHDVESSAGLAAAATVASWEEQHGFRSSFNLVADEYPIDRRLVDDLVRRGHEIGSHALRHDRSLFASREAFESQIPRLREAAERFGATGFRSPSTHRVVPWLAELPFDYDCTMPHSDPYEPIPGGTCTLWPFLHGEVVELPYTAPQDHTLFTLLGHRDGAVWRAQFERVVGEHGLFQLLTHPDPGYLGSRTAGEAYRGLLAAIARERGVWVALPREIAAWWRRRIEGDSTRDDGLARWTGRTIELTPTASSVAGGERIAA